MHILVNCSRHSGDDNSKHTGRLFRSGRAGATMERKREEGGGSYHGGEDKGIGSHSQTLSCMIRF